MSGWPFPQVLERSQQDVGNASSIPERTTTRLVATSGPAKKKGTLQRTLLRTNTQNLCYDAVGSHVNISRARSHRDGVMTWQASRAERTSAVVVHSSIFILDVSITLVVGEHRRRGLSPSLSRACKPVFGALALPHERFSETFFLVISS